MVTDYTYETLEHALEIFKSTMLTKFKSVEHKHTIGSVTKIGSGLFEKSYPEHESHESLRSRFEEEVQELRESRTIRDEIEETVDVANMAFLLWWSARASL